MGFEKQIKEKCVSNELEFRIIKNTESGQKEVYIKIPMAREEKEILIRERDINTDIIESGFEKCKLIKGYDAIWSEELRLIECSLDFGPSRMPPTFLYERIARALGFTEEENGEREDSEEQRTFIELPSPIEALSVFIGQSSLEHSILCGMQRPFLTGRIPRRPTIRFVGLNVTMHDQAKLLLEKLANTFLFQLDLSTGIPLYLSLERERRYRREKGRERFEMTAPRYEYDKEPMSLYWYARTATGIPLLQFLAYYQVLEFYFPVYSQRDAQLQIRNLIKDPRFNINRDADVSKILSIIKITGGGKAFGDERSQLKATICSCINNEELREYFKNDLIKLEFYQSKKSKVLAKQSISIDKSDVDIRMEVSERIYEIRCRIVHTKNLDDNNDLLLPFSAELRSIQYDLELLEYIARKVLIAASRPLQV